MSTETFLDPNASLISCDVFVREKVLGPEDVVYDSWLVVISIPAYVQGRLSSGLGSTRANADCGRFRRTGA